NFKEKSAAGVPRLSKDRSAHFVARFLPRVGARPNLTAAWPRKYSPGGPGALSAAFRKSTGIHAPLATDHPFVALPKLVERPSSCGFCIKIFRGAYFQPMAAARRGSGLITREPQVRLLAQPGN